VYVVTRATPDGQYLFEDPEQAQAYAALFPGATTDTATVIGRDQAASLIERELAELAADEA
jgi:hypothetical protein